MIKKIIQIPFLFILGYFIMVLGGILSIFTFFKK